MSVSVPRQHKGRENFLLFGWISEWSPACLEQFCCSVKSSLWNGVADLEDSKHVLAFTCFPFFQVLIEACLYPSWKIVYLHDCCSRWHFDVCCVRISAYKPSLLSMCIGINVCVICLCMHACSMLGAVLALMVTEDDFMCCHAYHH